MTRAACFVLLLIAKITAYGQDVWVDDGSTVGGQGTEADPYHWGNSAEQFDSGMRSFGAGTVFHLVHLAQTRNLFQTRGAYANAVDPNAGFQLKSDQQILGGEGVVLRLVYVVPDETPNCGFNIALGAISDFFFGGTSANGVLIQDLTVDCNGPQLKAQRLYSTVQGIELAGERNVLRNVTVINAIDDRALAIGYDENFIVSLSSFGRSSSGNLIDHCTVKDFIVDYNRNGSRAVMCSAISMRVRPRGDDASYRITGTIQNCSVQLNGFKSAANPDQEYGLNVSFSTNIIIRGNTITGATRGFNNDAGPNSGLLITDNRINQPPNSCGVFLGSSCDSILRANTFNLPEPGTIAIKVQGLVNGQEAVRWQITGNQVHSLAAGNNGIYFYPAPQDGPGMPTDIDVQGNTFSGEVAYINVPKNVARGGNYFARNSGTVRYFTPLTEPAGVPRSAVR